MLKSMIGKEQLPNFEFKNAIISMASNDDIHNRHEAPGFHKAAEGRSLLSRMDFAREVNLSKDIRQDIDGFVYRYINAKSYQKDYPNLRGLQFFPNATRYFQSKLKEKAGINQSSWNPLSWVAPAGGRELSPRQAIALISNAVEDTMATTPGFKQAHVSGQPFIVDYDKKGGLKAIAVKP